MVEYWHQEVHMGRLYRRALIAILIAMTSGILFSSCGSPEGGIEEEQHNRYLIGISYDDVAGDYGYIDKSGDMVIPPQFYMARSFSEGLAAVAIGEFQSEMWGFIDTTGAMVVQPQFRDVKDFSEGLAAVQVWDSETLKWGYIDRTGTMVIPPRFSLAWDFSDGMARVSEGNGKWGYIDPTGRMAIQPQWDLVESLPGLTFDFADGLAVVPVQDDQVGLSFEYIDKDGRSAFEKRFNWASDFSEGLAAVLEEGKWGYIDEAGDMVIPPRFQPLPHGISYMDPACKERHLQFSEGLAPVYTVEDHEGKWGYIDMQGGGGHTAPIRGGRCVQRGAGQSNAR